MVYLVRGLSATIARRMCTEVQYVREEYDRMDQRLETLKFELDLFEETMAEMTEDDMALQDPVDLQEIKAKFNTRIQEEKSKADELEDKIWRLTAMVWLLQVNASLLEISRRVGGGAGQEGLGRGGGERRGGQGGS